MRLLSLVILAGCAGTSTPPPEPSADAATAAIVYPDSPREDHVDTYHGVEVADPYRWLEDPDSEASRTWIDAQNAVTNAWLAEIPERDAIEKRLTTLWDRERWGVPRIEGGKAFYRYNDGTMNQAVLMMADAAGEEGTVVLDPNTFSDDGTASLGSYEVSPDGKRLVYAISKGGSDWRTYKVRNLETGEDTEDTLEWIKFSNAAWKSDSSGFFYSRYPETDDKTAANRDQKVYFHALGTPQYEDPLVYENPDEPDWGFHTEVTEDGQWLVITITVGTEEKTRIHLLDLTKPDAEPVKILDSFDANYWFIGKRGHAFFFNTTNEAPKGRIVSIDHRKDGPEAWLEIVGEGEHVVRRAALVGETLFVTTLRDAQSHLAAYSLKGKTLGDVALPGVGSIYGIASKEEATTTYFGFQGFTQPDTIFRLDVESREVAPVWELEIPFDPADFTTEQVFATSKDGTKVPIFLTSKGTERPSGAPTLLYGYGGFNIPVTPGFKARNLAWVEMGGVYASTVLRGGGEYGETWHQAGTKTQKQNVFDDFIAAGEWLRDNGVSKGIAIHGRSNGGLLAGATILQRPDLFDAAIPSVGVLDMLKYHQWTIGWAWSSDYGTVDDKAEFEALHAYSPVHNATKGDYPHVLIATADHDDRVVPAHSFKFAAALQHAQTGPDPVLIRIETQAGHGAGKSQKMRIEEARDELAFLVRALEMTPDAPSAPSE